MSSRAGIAYPDVIDLVTEEPDGEWALIVVEEGDWTGSQDQLKRLQEKLNNYLKFALDGEMARLHPESKGKKVRIQLDLYSPPDPKTMRFIKRLEEAISAEGLRLTVNVIRRGHA
jgi:Family of unknown function (DUF6572)